jgi:hypothetical protein
VQLLERAESEFHAGRATRADRRQSRSHFARAAEAYEALRQRGYRNADLFRNEGNAYLLAGDLPRAILAYRRGLRLAPGDRQLRANLAAARAEVAIPSPGSFGRPPEEFWLSWVLRPRPAVALLGAVLAFSLYWVALTRYFMVRRFWLLKAALVALAAGLMLKSYALWESWNRVRDIPHPLVVVARDGVVLRKGNGFSYPPRNPAPLNRGVEAQELFMRGDWLQIRLTGGEVGWVPLADVLVDTDIGL